MKLLLAIWLGKLVSIASKKFGLGAGATWPGEIALKLDPKILQKIAPKNIILVAGTNGKTTTTLMIKHMLSNRVVTNASGANLLNGIVSAIITSPPDDWGVFEVDENSLPQVLKFIKPKIIVLLNLFRDQLDRYGELDVIAEKWQKALTNFPGKLILNSDDPLIASFGRKNAVYFGLNDRKLFQKNPEHAMDSQFCSDCDAKLVYDGTFYSHLGIWHCPDCLRHRPTPNVTTAKYPLAGVHNRYNALAAVAVAKALNIKPNLTGFHPAFGRQEEINGVKILLSKNPAGFNESLRAVLEALARPPLAKVVNKGRILLVLNDRIPDGRDVSWIWDVDFEMMPKISITASGDRVYDLALRLKYAGVDAKIVPLEDGVKNADYILATYSAMLEVRKILTGKKIL